ncbi:E4-ORFB [Bat mastadenovirus]|uniref:E4-ORFB n=1 Tax=Bat mastadenovirus TaxID=740971 RepID=A0A3G9EAN5_9ADEN|nr:E4-ORFB [Bat mastadenovirus]BBE29327.1 E4-ORFB [Bat mastadenovirus]
MASGGSFFYECHITVKDILAGLIRDKELEADLCRGISMFLYNNFNLTAVRRLSSHTQQWFVSSIVYCSENPIPPSVRSDIESFIKVYTRGWIEGFGCAIEEDLHSAWLNYISIHFLLVKSCLSLSRNDWHQR